jgi:hypothetical protein
MGLVPVSSFVLIFWSLQRWPRSSDSAGPVPYCRPSHDTAREFGRLQSRIPPRAFPSQSDPPSTVTDQRCFVSDRHSV